MSRYHIGVRAAETINPSTHIGSYGRIFYPNYSPQIRWNAHSVFTSEEGVVIDGGRCFNVSSSVLSFNHICIFILHLVHSLRGKPPTGFFLTLSVIHANDFQNHLCDPNVITKPIAAPGKATVIFFKAVKKIQAGEWITISYWGATEEVSSLSL
jgi:hypothetical protein